MISTDTSPSPIAETEFKALIGHTVTCLVSLSGKPCRQEAQLRSASKAAHRRSAGTPLMRELWAARAGARS